jgi:hypothetical protein
LKPPAAGDRPLSDWSAHLPPARRRRILLERGLLRWRNRLFSRSGLVLIMVLAYLAICASLLVWGNASLGLLGLLPLMLTPPLGYLAYWLVWHEFHR